jgi:hypothetical protein
MNRYAISIAYALGVLLFFLPFVEIKCNATPLYEAKGIDLVTGFTVKEDLGKNKFDDVDVNINDNSNERQEGNVFAIAAFALGIIGLILSFLNFRSKPMASTITGVLGAICLIALMIQVKADVEKWGSKGNTNTNSNTDLFGGMTKNIKITADFTPWFYLALLSFLVAAFLSYRKGLPSVAAQPPKHAPQVPIQNPGDQSEFPKSASESEIG